MNKLALVILSACSFAVFAGTANVAKAPPGTDNVSFGYGAAAGSSGANLNLICIGTDSGLFGASNTNCVYIGAGAGTGATNRVGDVVIGDAFVHTNGVTTIKGFSAGIGGEDVTNIVNSIAPSAKVSIGSVTNANGQAVFSDSSDYDCVNVQNGRGLWMAGTAYCADVRSTAGDGVSLTNLNAQVQTLKTITIDAYWHNGMPTGSVLKVIWEGIQIGTINFNSTMAQ